MNLLKLISELQTRIERLESEVSLLGGTLPPQPPPKPRRGRKARLNPEVVLLRRVRLTAWLETNWPQLSVPLRRAQKSGKTSEAIEALIGAPKDSFRSPHHSQFYDTPERFEKELAAFFKSGRYFENPRNLAAAMAGLPELSWKRSFDICSMHPYKTDHKIPAYRDHLRRNFPDRLRELDDAKTELDVRIVLARSRTDDPLLIHLRENPGSVKEWLEAGKLKAPELKL